ncbi:GNAT family N-acetyltransferase [Clostridium manihotivorum]|uniref:N-acetyltransferase domain-containing protein n=1 Tax=Clostridium manihotivorum TaxID=2320868 RepID=A0A3R5U8X4_9CLOT|nr:GNAT family N-acetyltransferase [Clostridium manihotivorum]QAA32242.1 hypothetical protein C1I91_11660 [Clostridium manihotivorum]
MAVYIEQYKNDYKQEIEKLIVEDSFVRKDIIATLDLFPQYGLVIKAESEVLAVGAFTGADKKSSMTLYVKPARRGKGIGTKLLKALENNMRNAGVEEIVCDFKDNKSEKMFLYKNGYKSWFYSSYMVYTGDKVSLDDCGITNYDDKDYYKCQKILSEAFHKMRLFVGIKSTLSVQSEKQKNYYRENSENIFVLREDNNIVAVTILEDNEIDGVAVRIDMQGKGYGKKIVSYSVNKLLDRGFKNIGLWVVKGNPARFLYEKLGFKSERMHEFVTKSIR